MQLASQKRNACGPTNSVAFALIGKHYPMEREENESGIKGDQD
jgi:hypothetical protein